MSRPPQSFENHAMIVPLYHRWATGFLVIPTLYFGYRAVTAFSADTLMAFVFAVGVILTAFFTRRFPIRVQDRVIRLEERLRMQRLLPSELQDRIPDFTTRQLIALRFASDGELEGLARQVLDGTLTEPKEIKRAVRDWRRDHQRI